jgi:hypothetical protein
MTDEPVERRDRVIYYVDRRSLAAPLQYLAQRMIVWLIRAGGRS